MQFTVVLGCGVAQIDQEAAQDDQRNRACGYRDFHRKSLAFGAIHQFIPKAKRERTDERDSLYDQDIANPFNRFGLGGNQLAGFMVEIAHQLHAL
ncbi:hypothetical protein [Mycobacterium marinum]|uniref:hypothetical protein n=1 Tax=Mycobacterium marinum TaxID=1781 RepID=UPI00356770FC